jgi:hypothetical protein
MFDWKILGFAGFGVCRALSLIFIRVRKRSVRYLPQKALYVSFGFGEANRRTDTLGIAFEAYEK